jgi:hypothetical protein
MSARIQTAVDVGLPTKTEEFDEAKPVLVRGVHHDPAGIEAKTREPLLTLLEWAGRWAAYSAERLHAIALATL